MDMSLDAPTLAALFEHSRDAVIGVENDIVQFANPKAEALLDLRPGDRASRVLPEELFRDAAERFTGTTPLGGRSAAVSVVRLGAMAILRLTTEGDAGPSLPPHRAGAEFANCLSAAQYAAGALAQGAAEARDDRLTDMAALLRRNLFRLQRLETHWQLAEAFRRDSVAFDPKPLLMNRLCADLCQSVDALASGRGVSVRFEEWDGCWIRGDESLLETLLLNLMANSLLHMPEGGELRLSLSVQGERCCVALRDNGDGVPVERLEDALLGRASAPLTDAAAGAGLGLYLCRSIAELHGGSLLFESREGVGTGVRLLLPRLPEDGIQYLSHPDAERHLDGLRPILTELSVWLDRSFYQPKFMD